MKEIVIISGKGGTGKTSLVASLAALADKPVLADCDVDAADLHLVLAPKIKHEENFSGGKQAKILQEKCTGSGKCREVCRFNAVWSSVDEDDFSHIEYFIDSIACEGCGVCAWFCPAEAIEFKEAVNGRWFISDTRFGPMVHAKLGIAEENSGKLVTLVRNQAKKIAEENKHPYIIADGSPGIGCPVIASITGSDLVIVVTEPTVSGKHDLERVADLTKHFGIPTVVCINKFDINPEMAEHIGDISNTRGLPVIGKIRYDKAVTKAQIERISVVEYTNGPVSEDIKAVWNRVVDIFEQKESLVALNSGGLS
jgi:MinD superfamily P-loop ATPase